MGRGGGAAATMGEGGRAESTAAEAEEARNVWFGAAHINNF
jgi:hypothetical protein